MKINSAIILAGGKSSRMGFDKQLIEINGKLIVDYISEKLRSHFDEILVVTNSPDLYQGKDYILTQDIFPGHGPLAGIHAGLKLINSQGAYVIACDMPIINHDFVNYLQRLFEEKDTISGIISSYGKFIEPMNGIYSKAILGELENSLKNKELKIKILVDKLDFIIVREDILNKFDPKETMFKNINYEEDLKEFKNEIS